jgi:hypothetical protein
MPTNQQFNAAKAVVLDRIRHYSTVHLPEITPDTILGRTIWEDGKVKTPGVGLDAGRRSNVQIDINAWLRSRPHRRLLHAEEVAGDVTVNDLINYTAYSLA